MHFSKGNTVLPSVAGSSADNWWLRSANSNNDNNVGYVNSNGNVNNNNANNTNGCSPAFWLIEDNIFKGIRLDKHAFQSMLEIC